MTEKERFEAWIKPSGLSISKRPNGAYVELQVDDMWDGWQAAIASRADLDEDNRLLREQNDMLDKELARRERTSKDWTEADAEHLKRGQENSKKAWAGVDVEKFLQRETQPMPLEKAEEIAHRTASRYTHKTDKSSTVYTFLPHTIDDFVRKIERFHGIES